MGRTFAILLAAALGCSPAADCNKIGECPSGTYGGFSGNCLYDPPLWKECSDPHSICQGADCTGNQNNTCTYGGSTVPSKFCCGASTVVGSLDCPANQTYDGQVGLFCGVTCQRPGSQCCNNGRCGSIGGVCAPASTCNASQYSAACPDGTHRCCSVNMVCCHDTANGGAIGCEFTGFCQ